MEHKSHSEEQPKAEGWERETLIRLASTGLQEQRRARRWGIFFKLLTFVYLAVLLVMLIDIEYEEVGKGEHHTALIEIKGVIFAGEDAGADNVISGLRAAFKDENTKGVILRINSPGGSPVQAGYIFDEIIRLREKYKDIPLYAVIADIAASGGYYVASAADKIYADKASIVGSIGVRMDSFGFVEAMEKLGIERRLMTAGEHKALLDPFLPLSVLEKDHVQRLLNDIHRQFIEAVKKGRGDRLKDNDELYSGLVWSGEQSVELGFVDVLGSAGFVSREVIGVEEVKDFTKQRDWLERFVDRAGVSMMRIIESRLTQPGLQY